MAYYQLSLDKKTNKIWKKEKRCRILKRKMLFSEPIERILARILENSRRIKILECEYVKHRITKILDQVSMFVQITFIFGCCYDFQDYKFSSFSN